MDKIDTGDIYFSYLTSEKLPCDTEINILQSENEGNLEPVETMFADIGDGNLPWTIDGYSILMDAEQTKDAIITNIKSTSHTDLPMNGVPLSNESLFLQLNMELPNVNQTSIDNNNVTEIIEDPIINGSGAVKSPQKSFMKMHVNNATNSLLKNCNSILKSSTVDPVKIADIIEEVSAFSCRKCGILCRARQDITQHVEACHLEKNGVRYKPPPDKTRNEISTKVDNDGAVSIVYLCGICGQVGYNSQKLLKQHMIIIHGMVENVQKISENSSSIVANTESKEKSVPTNNSSNILRNYQLFVQNQQRGVSKVRCSIRYCESRFATDELRLRHEKCHDLSAFKNDRDEMVSANSLKEYKYKCTECSIRFILWKSCSSHLWTRHRIDIGLYSCPLCTKFKSISPHLVFSHLSSTHLATNNPTSTTKPCLCNICGARYKTLSQLRIHIERTHLSSTDGAPIARNMCATCQRTFSTAQTLRRHTDQMHTKRRTFACTLCAYKTGRRDSLGKHMRSHTGERPFKCKMCVFRAVDQSTLKKHEMRHMGIASYACPHCPYTCIQSVSYKRHLLQQHPFVEGVYTCAICGMRYIRHEAYIVHMRDHRMGLVHSSRTANEEADDDSDEGVLSRDKEGVGKQDRPFVSILRRPVESINAEESDQESVDDPDQIS